MYPEMETLRTFVRKDQKGDERLVSETSMDPLLATSFKDYYPLGVSSKINYSRLPFLDTNCLPFRWVVRLEGMYYKYVLILCFQKQALEKEVSGAANSLRYTFAFLEIQFPKMVQVSRVATCGHFKYFDEFEKCSVSFDV